MEKPIIQRRDFCTMLAGALAGAGLPAVAQAAETWPSAPGRIIVGFAPGTVTDSQPRALGATYQNWSGKPFVVDNRPGANGWTGTLQCSQAKPDGLTLTFNANGITIYDILQKNTFDATKDLTPIAMVSIGPVAMMVNSSLPVNNVKEFIAYCKAHPNDVSYASSGVGSAVQLYSELFNLRAGIKMRHVPYRGLGESLPDLIAGRVQVVFGGYTTFSGLIKAGQLRLLAFASDIRPPGSPPNIPNVRDSGLDYEAINWYALFGPPGMSPELTNTINAATNKALKEPALTKIFEAGLSPWPMTPAGLAAEVKKNHDLLKSVVDAAHLTF